MKRSIIMLFLLLWAAFLNAAPTDECDNGRTISRACCVTSADRGEQIPVDEIDSILLMPGTCAIPPFCQTALPYADVFHEKADMYCAPQIDAFDTSRIEFIICKNIDRAFTCYGRATNASFQIDFGASSPTPCAIDGNGMIRADAACRVNVRLYEGNPSGLSSMHPLTFRPILQPALAPFRGFGATRILLKRDTAWLGDLDDATLFVDALLPACTSKEEFAALSSQFQQHVASNSWLFMWFWVALVVILIVLAYTEAQLTKKIEEARLFSSNI